MTAIFKTYNKKGELFYFPTNKQLADELNDFVNDVLNKNNYICLFYYFLDNEDEPRKIESIFISKSWDDITDWYESFLGDFDNDEDLNYEKFIIHVSEFNSIDGAIEYYKKS